MAKAIPILDPALAEARLPHWMLALGGAGTISILVADRVRFGAGFAIGSGLAILSYLWLHQAVEALMTAGEVHPSLAMMAKILVRYPLAFGVVYLFYETGWLPFRSILAGLFVPMGGVLIESLVLIRHGLKAQN